MTSGGLAQSNKSGDAPKFIAAQSSDQWVFSKFKGSDVIGPNNEVIGGVNDMLFDKSGKLAYHGTIDDNRNDPAAVKNHYLKDALDAVLSGRPAPVAETKGLGCGIKFR